METMSQDAINEMVETAFQCADTDSDGKISFEEFKKWVSQASAKRVKFSDEQVGA